MKCRFVSGMLALTKMLCCIVLRDVSRLKWASLKKPVFDLLMIIAVPLRPVLFGTSKVKNVSQDLWSNHLSCSFEILVSWIKATSILSLMIESSTREPWAFLAVRMFHEQTFRSVGRGGFGAGWSLLSLKWACNDLRYFRECLMEWLICSLVNIWLLIDNCNTYF